MGERELDDALVALREPTRGVASAPLEPIVRAAAVRRRRARLVQAVVVLLAALVVGAGLVGLAGRGSGGLDVQTQGPGMRFGTEGPATPEQLDRTAQLVKARLDALGEGEAEVTVEDGGVVVRKAQDPDAVGTAVAPSILAFRPVLQQVAPQPPASGLPDGVERLPDAQTLDWYDLGPSDVDGSVVQSARANVNQVDRWTVNPVLRAGRDGIDRFNALADQCYAGNAVCPTKRLAIVVAGKVVSAPTINSYNFKPDQIEISGQFTEQSARELAALLDLGNLPVTLTPR